jgi:hypothetical protein
MWLDGRLNSHCVNVKFGTVIAKIKPLYFWKIPRRSDIMAATDLVTDQLWPRFQAYVSIDAGDLAENGRISQYMLSFFLAKKGCLRQGGVLF